MEKETVKADHKIIGCAESGSGETFGYLVVTAVYADSENEARERYESEAKDITQISSWEDIEERNEQKNTDELLLYGDRFATVIITNEEYNKRYGDVLLSPQENKNDIMTEAYAMVLGEIDKKYPGSRIVISSFFGTKEEHIEGFKYGWNIHYSRMYPSIDINHVELCANACSKTMTVALASKISAYICRLCHDHVQEMLALYKHDSETELCLPKGSPNVKDLREFLLKLKPELRKEFINKYMKKSFNNVEGARKGLE